MDGSELTEIVPVIKGLSVLPERKTNNRKKTKNKLI